MKRLQILAGGLLLFFTVGASAQTSVEVKLKAPIDEDRGWCLDLRGGQNNGAPIGGVHGHTCYTYIGKGPTKDQAFMMENIKDQNEFRMVAFNDKCMTLFEPNEGSFVSIETCDGRETQDIAMNDSGQIIPEMTPELCLTAGSVVLPGGGGNPIHIMRDISFEACDSAINERQLWELRAEWSGPEEATAERTFPVNPVRRTAN
ncbi:MAG TPA: hypothetical protein DCY55_05095 [Gammaproteobacteria bacterium]|mgnify:CR=1 FL=1|jgi:hypothetical protein|nr:RICIN domain-containing protein [Pseudomonadota bacterium]HAY45643.1 hypothetical protein [Gammaproteobacteria bacterium]